MKLPGSNQFVVVVLIWALAPCLISQDKDQPTGAIMATVVDSGGKRLSLITVEAKEKRKPYTAVGVTDDEGVVYFRDVPIGAYDIRIRAKKYIRADAKGIQVSAGKTSSIRISLISEDYYKNPNIVYD